MSKAVTIILIISSTFVVGLSILTVLLHQHNSETKAVSEQSYPTPTITTIMTLTLVPQNISVMQGQVNTVTIVLERQNSVVNTPRLIQMEIAYDPTALWDVAITPGDFFDNPRELLKVINTNTGRISYALSSDTQLANTETRDPVVARLTFVPNPSFIGSETTISFLGKTAIKGMTDDPNITATYGTRLLFASGSATPN